MSSIAIWRGDRMPVSEVAKRVPPEHWDEVRVRTDEGTEIRYGASREQNNAPSEIDVVDDSTAI